MSIEAYFNLVREGFELDIKLSLPSKGVSAIFGSSGCGKTTLLRLIAGLEYCRDGYLKVGDSHWQNKDKVLPAYKRPIGYVFQESSLFPHLNVQENIEFGMKRISKGEQKISLDRAVQLMGLSPLMKRRSSQLSGGERQRVAIARALAVSPNILLMDEPLASLNLERKQEIMSYLQTLHHELDIPIIYVSHSLGEVARLADYMVFLDNGRVKEAGRIDELFSRLDLPLAQSDKAAALFQASVASHDKEFGLTYLDFPGGRLAITYKNLNIGQSVRLRIVARDVSLTLERQTHTSIQNIFPVIIKRINPEGESQVMVELSVKGVPILSRITKKSAITMKLEPGKKVFAQVKTIALLS